MATLRRLVSASGERVELRLAKRAPDIPAPADLVEHGRRLADVLLLADAVPVRQPRSRDLDGPRILSTP
jgi:hypothetical protein